MRNEAHMNYLRRKTADVAELWAADRIEQLEADTQEVNAARIYLREKHALLRDLAEAQAQIKVLRGALENCRLLAARHRKEDWALRILIFCDEVGCGGSITR